MALKIEGATSAGDVVSAYAPVFIGAVDSTGKARNLTSTADGYLVQEALNRRTLGCGPRTFSLKGTGSTAELMAAPGAGYKIHILHISLFSESELSTAATLSVAGENRYKFRLPGLDTSFYARFDCPWTLPEDTALDITITLNSDIVVNIDYYIAA